jgi:hypothetical protein
MLPLVPGQDKWIRPLKDNAAGKVVKDAAGSRWEWDAQQDETSRQLRKLQNDELAIEQTNITPNPHAAKGSRGARRTATASPPTKSLKKAGPDAGGGFNPYDSSGKPPRR